MNKTFIVPFVLTWTSACSTAKIKGTTDRSAPVAVQAGSDGANASVHSPAVNTPAPIVSPTPALPVVAPAAAPAAADPCVNFSSVDWLNGPDPKGFTCYKNLQAVFASVPTTMNGYWSLMTASRSRQPASPQFPRLIVDAPDGSAYIAAATDPAAAPFLDVATFDYKKNQWVFTGIDFSTSPPTTETASCPVCHGSPAHPIWTTYAVWTGNLVPSSIIDADAAKFLTAAASGTTGLPLLTTLSYLPLTAYAAGSIFADVSRFGDSESNQILNFSISKNTNRRLSRALLSDSKVTPAQIYGIAYAAICGGDLGSELKAAGYPQDVYLRSNLVTTDGPDDLWTGSASMSNYLPIDLLHEMMKKDATLATKLPDMAKVLADPNLAVFFASSLSEWLGATSSWYPFDYGWFPTYKALWTPTGATCTTLQTLSVGP